MTGAWGLPMQAVIEDRVYEIHTDYRDILELLRWLDGTAAPELDRGERWYVAMRLFYPDFAAMPRQDWQAATRFLTRFLSAGRPEPDHAAPRLMDWQQDAPLIAAGIQQATGQDVRALPYLHWWSFLGWFAAMEPGALGTVVAIRDKLHRGRRLEGWELEYYRAHRDQIDLRPAPTAAERAERDRLLALLDGGPQERRGEDLGQNTTV